MALSKKYRAARGGEEGLRRKKKVFFTFHQLQTEKKINREKKQSDYCVYVMVEKHRRD